MLAVSLLASILFLGGWHGPIPVSQLLGWTFDNGFWSGIAGNVLGTLNMLFKGLLGVTVMMWVRWTLPRLRIDQVITTCLKYCVPIAALAFLGATWWQYTWPNGAIIRNAPAAYTVHELGVVPAASGNETPPPADAADAQDQVESRTAANASAKLE
jgi:NADH-quinone oxidoreductase subunit H